MGYTEAIDQQAMMRNWYGSAAGREQLYRVITARDPGVQAADLDGAGQRIITGLSMGQSFWVNAHMATLITAAEETWPAGASFTFQDLPESHGFIWFESPLPLPRRDDGAVRDLCAVSWSTYAVFDGQEFVPLRTDGRGDEGVYLVGYTRTPSTHPIAGVIGCQPLVFSDVNAGAVYPTRPGMSGQGLVRSERVARYFRVFCALVKQRVLAIAHRTVTNRQARRRLARTCGHVPDVHVVELRRRDYPQRDESHDGPVEWSCQWLVRGHWHRYHTLDGLRPRWLAPYVKGDPDKPLKTPCMIAYEVTR